MKNSDLKEKCDSFFKHNFFFLSIMHTRSIITIHIIKDTKNVYRKKQESASYHQKGGNENAKV